jgi:hypothetical protein
MVGSGGMRPCDALELYCERLALPSNVLVDFAEDELDYDVFIGAMEEIDDAYMESDIFEALAWIKGRSA